MTARPPPRPDRPPAAPDPPALAARWGRRELSVVLVLTAAGAVLALVAGGRTWLQLAAPRRPPLPDVAMLLSGRDVEPLVPALGLVGLAGLVALLATRGWGRLAVGALLAAAGAVLAVRSAGRLGGPDPAAARALLADAGKASGLPPGTAVTAAVASAGPLLATVGGLALLAAGVGALLRSRRWPAMSARYDRPATQPTTQPPAGSSVAAVPPPATAADPAAPVGAAERVGAQHPDAVWDALDRGDDPTAT